MENKPELSIIIVNWHSKPYLHKCLKSISAQTKALIEVIVIDNASYDGCGDMIKQEFPSVIFIQSTTNLGFAGANNEAFKKSRGRFLLFLNPDTEFLEDTPSLFIQYLNFFKETAIIGCCLLNEDRSLQISCIQSFPTICNQALDSEYLRERFPASRLWESSAFHSRNFKPFQVEAVSGACLAIPRSIFIEIGGFTEGYFMYGEDVDLCYKATQAGHSVFFIPETQVFHYGGKSTQQSRSNFSSIMTRESIFRFFMIYHGAIRAYAYRFIMIAMSVLRLALIVLLQIFRSSALKNSTASTQKWISIFRWGVGLESWAKQT
jgi:GT2 family glycosyltransferase